MVLNVVGSNPIGHPKKSLATFRCEGFLFSSYYSRYILHLCSGFIVFFAYVAINVYICFLNLTYKNG